MNTPHGSAGQETRLLGSRVDDERWTGFRDAQTGGFPSPHPVVRSPSRKRPFGGRAPPGGGVKLELAAKKGRAQEEKSGNAYDFVVRISFSWWLLR